MESLDETGKSVSSKMGFFKYVFNFDEDSKNDIMNIIQYALLAVIPVVVLNKTMQKFVPEADEEKGSFEILAEVVIQIIFMFLGLLIIHRIICYIPRYSGTKYPDFNINCIILSVLVIVLSLQTKLGEKVSILVDRVSELWEGKKDDDTKKGKGKKNGVKVSQPISQGQSAMTQSLYAGSTNMGASSDGTSISSLPTMPTAQQQQQLPDYNAMHRSEFNPMPGAATPGMDNGGMIMAANEVLGGSAFGANF